MDFEKSLVSKIIHTGDLSDVMSRRITNHMMTDDKTRKVFIFILDYYYRYSEVPPVEVMEHEFPDYPLPLVKEPVNYCIDKIVEQYVRNKGSHIILEKAKDLVRNPMQGLEDLKTKLNQLRVETDPTDDSSIIDSVPQRKEHYLKLKNLGGIDGYSTPWEILDDMTMGWHPEDLAIIVARTGVGKSWFLLLLAHHAWKQGLNVLVVSNEMSSLQIERRLDAINFKLPYKELKAGLLPDAYEERYLQGLDELGKRTDLQPIHTISHVSGVSSIKAKIDQYAPDILFVDGLYLLHDDNRSSSKWERISNISWDLKRMAKDKKIPTIATTQFNRTVEGVKFDQVTLGGLGFADSIGYDADAIFGLFRNKDMELNNEMYVRTLKIREDEPKDFTLNWDLRAMDFSLLHVDNTNEVIVDNEIEDDVVEY